jgi:pimeloyl-ACP methyl ester carboxylesterase
VQLHYVESGDGPLVVLLHGFPEFWYGWRKQIAPLVKAGFRVVAPDLRGYNLSSKPDRFTDYTADKMAADISGLIHELGAESAMVVGHDWGGSVAWSLAMNHPEVIDRLAILNAAHPRKLNEGLKHPRQLRGAGTSSTSSSRVCPSAARAVGIGGSSSASCATPARSTRTRSSIATSARGPSPERRRR